MLNGLVLGTKAHECVSAEGVQRVSEARRWHAHLTCSATHNCMLHTTPHCTANGKPMKTSLCIHRHKHTHTPHLPVGQQLHPAIHAHTHVCPSQRNSNAQANPHTCQLGSSSTQPSMRAAPLRPSCANSRAAPCRTWCNILRDSRAGVW